MTQAVVPYRQIVPYRALAVYRRPWLPRLIARLILAAAWLVGLTPVRLLLAGSVTGAVAALVLLLVSTPCALLLVPVGCEWVLKRRRRPPDTSLGSARWAEAERDLRPVGMLGDRGLFAGLIPVKAPTLRHVVGGLFDPRVPAREALDRVRRWRGGKGFWYHPVRLATSTHVAIFSPPSGGKTTGYALPHLLDCPDSFVCVDMKGELYECSASWRKLKFGHRVVVLDPMGATSGRSDCLDPLSLIDPDGPDCIDRIRALAEAMVVRTGQEKDRFWDDSAEVVLTAMMLAVVLFGRVVSLQAVRHLLTDRKQMQEAVSELEVSEAFDGIAARYGRQLRYFRGVTKAGVMATVGRHLRMLDTPSVQEVTSRTTFDPQDLLRGKLTVYIVLPPEYQRSHAGLVRLYLSTLIGVVVRGGVQEKNLVQVLVDEAAALQKLEVLSDCLQRYRGYGIRLTLLYQSAAQLDDCWGKADLLLGSVTSIWMGVNDALSCDIVSAATGDATVSVGGTSRNGGSGWSRDQRGQESYSRSWGWGDSEGRQQRRLVTPGEVRTEGPRTGFIFVPSLPPLAVFVPRSYDRPPDPPGRWVRGRNWLLSRVGAVLVFGLTTSLAARLAAPKEVKRGRRADAWVLPAGAGRGRAVRGQDGPGHRDGAEAANGPGQPGGGERLVPPPRLGPGRPGTRAGEG